MKLASIQFKKKWKLALSYQDKRDDKGHARIVTEFAAKLAKVENANEKIVIPAAMLHDIGWSNLSQEERFATFNWKINPEKELKIRLKHQEEGVKLARKILNKVNYPKDLTKKILEIISQHDTRKGFISKEDGAVRDADKLWRYSRIGIKADLRSMKITFNVLCRRIKKKINEPNFLFFNYSKKIADRELARRKIEFSH